MNRRSFLQVSFPTSLGLATGIGIGPQLPPSRSWTIGNNRVKIVLSEEGGGGLSAFTDLRSQRNFIAKAAPLYRFLLFQKGKDLVELSSLDATTLSVERSVAVGGEKLTLTYGRHRSLDITAVCSVLLEADSPLSKWRISVKNNTPYGIRAIQYPVVQAPLVLGDSAEDDYFAWGRFGGQLDWKPGQSLPDRREKLGLILPHDLPEQSRAEFRADGGRGASPMWGWLPDQYPGIISLQMQAYYDGTAGLYMATYDGSGNVKHFGLTRLKDGLDISIEHNYDERPGLSFDLPYDTVLGIFHGNWYAAADLYKQWAAQQSWCARKIVERDDLPAWLKEPRPTLQYECRGDYQRGRGATTFPQSDYPIGRFWPAKKVIPLTREFVSIFGTPVVVWYNGWEQIGDPCGPVDIFPPLEGEESLKAAMADLSRDGYYPFMAIWGMHWCYKRSMAGYDGWAHFEKEGRPLAAINDQGEVSRYIAGNMEKLFVQVCVGSHEAQKLYTEWFSKLMDLGAVALEFDHQVGGYPAVCYSDQHGHPPGYGPWMHQEMQEFMRGTRQMARQRNRDSILSMEGVCETWIQDMSLMLNRPYGPHGIPLFSYIYHEYIPLLGGDGRFWVSHLEAELMLQTVNFIAGNQSFLMIGSTDYDFEANPNYPIFGLLRNLFHAQRTYARPYQVLGQMLEPVELKTSKIRMDEWLPPGKEVIDPPTVDIPAVMSSVWRSPAGKIGYVLVNWTGASEEVTLGLVKKAGTTSLVTAAERKQVTVEEVKFGQVTTVVPARSILLVEQE